MSNIFLHHIFEDTEELAKLIAYTKVSSCCNFISRMTLSLGTITEQKLQTVIKRSINACLTRENVREICYEEHVDSVGSVGDEKVYFYRTESIEKIKETLVNQTLERIAQNLGADICRGLAWEMKTIVQDELSKEIRVLRFEISSDVFRKIENTLIIMIVEFFDNLYGWIRGIARFFITLFYPVDVNSEEWRTRVADEIFEKINAKRKPIHDFSVSEILRMCQKTVQDFDVITVTLENFKRKVIPTDQNQREYYI